MTQQVEAPSKPTWRERRAERRAARQHDAAVALWQAKQDIFDRMLEAARRAQSGGDGPDSGIVLKDGEAALWSAPATLVEPRREPGSYSGGSSGVSLKVAPGVRVRSGSSRGSYVPGDEVQTPVDDGRAVVTTQRVVFVGGKANREWLYSKLISRDSSGDGVTQLLAVSNRQKVSGLKFDKKLRAEFIGFVDLGSAIARYGIDVAVAEWARYTEQQRAEAP